MAGEDGMIISVASGKGGTGKTLVATSLVLSLSDKSSVLRHIRRRLFYRPFQLPLSELASSPTSGG